MQVEGGATRFLAIFQDMSNVGLVASIRSARHYSVQIAHSYDAILATYGGSPQGLAEIKALRVPHVSEGRSMLIRSPDRVSGRRFSREHTGSTSGDLVTRHLPGYGFRMDHEDGYDLGLVFVNNGTPENGSSATEAVARFSGSKSTTFIYDTEKEVYLVRQFSRDFIDANDNSRPSFTNVLMLKMSVSGIPGDGAGRRDIVTTGSGTGYFMCGGKYVEINWSRTDKSSPFVYTLKNGSVLELGRGKTYICIVPTNMNVTFE